MALQKARVINDAVIAISVPSLAAKEIILGSDNGNKIFTEPHYNGYPAVLVRLETIGPQELEDLIIEAWRCKAPTELVRQCDQSGPQKPSH